VDGVSDDGGHGITVIAFVGSVFSPYYRWARGRGRPAEAERHCAINVALYGRGGKRWAMTERGRGDLQRRPERLDIGPSSVRWEDGALRVVFDEVTAPLPSRLRGELCLTPDALPARRFLIDHAGRHDWQPFAPCARIEVRLESPRLHWQGHGYFDCNFGTEPLEAGFRDWDWSRGTLPDGSTTVLYEARTRDGGPDRLLSLHFGNDGRCETFAAPPRVDLDRSAWRVARGTRAELGQARVVQTLEDTPFYARSLLATRLLGQEITAVHESLSLERFRSPVVQFMLPFRMPRRARG
jgi:carotenoid 1,2-hydratase